uniref:GST N-terminal domain-containing protein n=1 Tax=Globisporangium ultimum (strain ATCC 200006 / CBS 805.95 / DAOM BR144) TaxID=431595 RepID=K3W5M4_GLOUD
MPPLYAVAIVPVAWVLKVKNVEHEVMQTDFGGPVFTSAEFLALNPNGLIPVLKDGDFSMFEGNAILIYLSEKYGWTDLFPSDLKTRAKIHQYLHWHHTNARLLTSQVLAPLIHSKVNALTPQDEEYLKNIDKVIEKNARLLEKLFVKDYIAETDAPTIADYAAYCEFGQTELMGVFDFSKYPKVAAWLKRMK